jgi:hypothetical protein
MNRYFYQILQRGKTLVTDYIQANDMFAAQKQIISNYNMVYTRKDLFNCLHYQGQPVGLLVTIAP